MSYYIYSCDIECESERKTLPHLNHTVSEVRVNGSEINLTTKCSIYIAVLQQQNGRVEASLSGSFHSVLAYLSVYSCFFPAKTLYQCVGCLISWQYMPCSQKWPLQKTLVRTCSSPICCQHKAHMRWKFLLS